MHNTCTGRAQRVHRKRISALRWTGAALALVLSGPAAAHGPVEPEEVDLFVSVVIGQGCRMDALTAPRIEAATGFAPHLLSDIVGFLFAEGRIVALSDEPGLQLVDPACAPG